MLTLSILASAVFAIMAVTIGSFAIETRRLRKIVEHLEGLNLGLTTELSICRGDLDEADAELNRLQGGRLLR